MLPGLSIIMPCYNAGPFIGEAIESILAQTTRHPFEVIVVDDGSDAPTRAVLEKLEGIDPRVRIFYLTTNKGPGHARNTATAHARYPYILPIDADDKIERDADFIAKHGSYLDRVVEVLDQQPDVVMVYALGSYFGARNQPWRMLAYNEKSYLYTAAVPVNAAYRKTEAREVGGFSTALIKGEDHDFHIRLLNHRFKAGQPREIIKLDEPYYHYRQHADGSNVNNRPLPLRDLLDAIYRGSPEIYEHHFPEIKGQDAGDFLMAQRRNITNAFRLAAGNPAWAFDRVYSKLTNILK